MLAMRLCGVFALDQLGNLWSRFDIVQVAVPWCEVGPCDELETRKLARRSKLPFQATQHTLFATQTTHREVMAGR